MLITDQFIYQEAEEGIYKAIGDGLRRHPEHLTPDAGATAALHVLTKNYAHINVTTIEKSSAFLIFNVQFIQGKVVQ